MAQSVRTFPFQKLPDDLQLTVAGFAGHSILPVCKDLQRKGIEAIFYEIVCYMQKPKSFLGYFANRHLQAWDPKNSTQANVHQLHQFLHRVEQELIFRINKLQPLNPRVEFVVPPHSFAVDIRTKLSSFVRGYQSNVLDILGRRTELKAANLIYLGDWLEWLLPQTAEVLSGFKNRSFFERAVAIREWLIENGANLAFPQPIPPEFILGFSALPEELLLFTGIDDRVFVDAISGEIDYDRALFLCCLSNSPKKHLIPKQEIFRYLKSACENGWENVIKSLVKKLHYSENHLRLLFWTAFNRLKEPSVPPDLGVIQALADSWMFSLIERSVSEHLAYTYCHLMPFNRWFSVINAFLIRVSRAESFRAQAINSIIHNCKEKNPFAPNDQEKVDCILELLRNQAVEDRCFVQVLEFILNPATSISFSSRLSALELFFQNPRAAIHLGLVLRHACKEKNTNLLNWVLQNEQMPQVPAADIEFSLKKLSLDSGLTPNQTVPIIKRLVEHPNASKISEYTYQKIFEIVILLDGLTVENIELLERAFFQQSTVRRNRFSLLQRLCCRVEIIAWQTFGILLVPLFVLGYACGCLFGPPPKRSFSYYLAGLFKTAPYYPEFGPED